MVATANPDRLFLARKLAARFKFPLLNPLLVAMVVIIPFLLLTGISYERYFAGSKVLNDLLQPAVVALRSRCMNSCTRSAPAEIYHYHLLYRQLRGDDHRHHRRSADGRHAANRRLYSA